MERQKQSGSLSHEPTAAPICAERIREQLRRILSSTDFVMPERIRTFLTYVVEESLAGRANRIKGYSIAVEVFGRDRDFDVLNDPVVRIEAGRLRRGLERYYLLEGKTDPVVIDIPKGSYVPSFRLPGNGRNIPTESKSEDLSALPVRRALALNWRNNLWLQGCFAAVIVSALAFLSILIERVAPVSEPIAPRPYIIVKTFENLSPKPSAAVVAAGVYDEVVAALAIKGELAIFRSGGAQSAAEGPTIHHVPKRYILNGTIRDASDKIRISSRLMIAETGQIVWSNAYDADTKPSIDNEVEIARKISTSVSRVVLPAKVQ